MSTVIFVFDLVLDEKHQIEGRHGPIYSIYSNLVDHVSRVVKDIRSEESAFQGTFEVTLEPLTIKLLLLSKPYTISCNVVDPVDCFDMKEDIRKVLSSSSSSFGRQQVLSLSMQDLSSSDVICWFSTLNCTDVLSLFSLPSLRWKGEARLHLVHFCNLRNLPLFHLDRDENLKKLADMNVQTVAKPILGVSSAVSEKSLFSLFYQITSLFRQSVILSISLESSIFSFTASTFSMSRGSPVESGKKNKFANLILDVIEVRPLSSFNLLQFCGETFILQPCEAPLSNVHDVFVRVFTLLREKVRMPIHYLTFQEKGLELVAFEDAETRIFVLFAIEGKQQFALKQMVQSIPGSTYSRITTKFLLDQIE